MATCVEDRQPSMPRFAHMLALVLQRPYLMLKLASPTRQVILSAIAVGITSRVRRRRACHSFSISAAATTGCRQKLRFEKNMPNLRIALLDLALDAINRQRDFFRRQARIELQSKCKQ